MEYFAYMTEARANHFTNFSLLRSAGFFGHSSSDEDAARRQREAERRERAQVTRIRNIQSGDLPFVLRWVADPNVQGHLAPLPQLPQDWNNQAQLEEALQKLGGYYNNVKEKTGEQDDPHKITPLVAANKDGDPVGVLTLRWRGDPYVPAYQRIAAGERLIVDPALTHLGIGTELLTVGLVVAFERYRGYSGARPAQEFRLWMMTDRQAGDYSINYNLFHNKFGFQTVQGGDWQDYIVRRDMSPDDSSDREARWLSLKEEGWQKFKEANPELVANVTAKTDFVNLRVA